MHTSSTILILGAGVSMIWLVIGSSILNASRIDFDSALTIDYKNWKRTVKIFIFIGPLASAAFITGYIVYAITEFVSTDIPAFFSKNLKSTAHKINRWINS
jgi:hypothetical protein